VLSSARAGQAVTKYSLPFYAGTSASWQDRLQRSPRNISQE
jgi:hypothetical protein